jgi:L-seryl-tRNA(Ser) seleniumtransferase
VNDGTSKSALGMPAFPIGSLYRAAPANGRMNFNRSNGFRTAHAPQEPNALFFDSLLRSLPSISALLERQEVQDWLHGIPRSAVVAALQDAVESFRDDIRAGVVSESVSIDELVARAEELLVRRSTPSLRKVINATGIVLHTGLGRAPLSDAAVEAIVEGSSGYCNLEYDLESGSRGRRSDHVSSLLSTLTGAEAAAVVNNNAAATFLILKTFAEGREAVVSRGQLVEIGGSYRLPDILRAAGARLREVGTTNRTRIGDYSEVIDPTRTALLLRVHTSNYRVVGFTEDVSIEQLVMLGRRAEIPVVDDLGSGALLDLAPYGAGEEPLVSKSVAAGADLVCFSGDKLLGGPQCGLIVGRADLIHRLEENPLMRTYRVDKLVLLALEATLRSYLDAEQALAEIPALAMLATPTEVLANRAGSLAEQLRTALPTEKFLVCSDTGFAGGGSMPGHEMETVAIQWRPGSGSAMNMAAALRRSEIPVICRLHDNALLFDLRTIRPADFESLVASVTAAAWELETEPAKNGIALPVVG